MQDLIDNVIEDAMQRLRDLDRPQKCGYVNCNYVYGRSPIGYEPEDIKGRQDFERAIFDHMEQAGHKQRRITWASQRDLDRITYEPS